MARNNRKEKLVIFTKEPVSIERVRAIKRLKTSKNYSIVGIFVEDAIHLPLYKFIYRTLQRIVKGYIFLPEFISNLLTFIVISSDNDQKNNLSLESLKLPVIKVKNIQHVSSIKKIKEMRPDRGLIIGHRIIPEKVFTIPIYGTLNVHHGILPRYAGSHTTFWRLVEGYTDVGITIHKVSKKVDSGDILYIKKIPVTTQKSHEAYQKVLDSVPITVYEALEGLSDKSLHFKRQSKKDRIVWKPPTLFQRFIYRKFL